MKKELNITDLSMKAAACYGQFSGLWRVTKDFATRQPRTKEEEKIVAKELASLVSRTAAMVKEAETTYTKIEDALKGVRGDEALLLIQTVRSYREALAEFKKAYPGKVEEAAERNA